MLNSEIIPFDRLQLGEVDWAGFLTKKVCLKYFIE
jgi:hypothetical protein